MEANGKGEFLKALIKAKGAFKSLVKNKENPHFKSEYADLAALHLAVDVPLQENGFALLQPLVFDAQGNQFLETRLMHVAGHEEKSVYQLPTGVRMQELGSAITYACRYSIQALLGIAPTEGDDDDGQAAQAAVAAPPKKKEAPKVSEEQKPSAAPSNSPPTKAGEVWVWRGRVTAVEKIGNGKWKITGQGPEIIEFATVSPDHAQVASGCSSTLCMATVKAKLQGNGVNVMLAIDPETKG